MERIFKAGVIIACVWMYVFCGTARALEMESCRLLSISESEKLVLVSRIPDRKKFLLDAADVKVTINDEPAELKDVASFTIVKVRMEPRKKKRKGVSLDGSALEIAIYAPAEK